MLKRYGVVMTKAEMKERWLCSPFFGVAGFTRWCERHVIIQDKESGGEAPLRFFEGQGKLAAGLVGWLWLTILKARQLGITWLMAAYCLWRVVYSRMFQACIINQERPYAQEFIERVRWILVRLPPWSQPRITVDSATKGLLKFGADIELRSLVGGDKAGRSFTGDLAIFDEASRIPDFGKTLGAIVPTMQRSTREAQHGQIIVLTTSAEAEGDYAAHWSATYGEGGDLVNAAGFGPTGFMPIFLSFAERPGRDERWYADAKEKLDKISVVMCKREYPRNPEEAFEYAEGRVYPLFTRARNVGAIDIPDYAQLGRCVDWGETKSAYVVLWYAYVPGPPGFLVHPDCKGTIHEFIAYRLDDSGQPMKEHDHACDAVRYAVTTKNLKGLVYVYREIHRLDTVTRGWTISQEITEVHELSGWVRAGPGSRRKWKPGRHAERFDLGTVADRSLGKVINEWCAEGIPTEGHVWFERKQAGKSKKDKPIDEKLEGIRIVGDLIAGTEDLEHYYEVTREERAFSALLRDERDTMGAAVGLEEARLIDLARELMATKGR